MADMIINGTTLTSADNNSNKITLKQTLDIFEQTPIEVNGTNLTTLNTKLNYICNNLSASSGGGGSIGNGHIYYLGKGVSATNIDIKNIMPTLWNKITTDNIIISNLKFPNYDTGNYGLSYGGSAGNITQTRMYCTFYNVSKAYNEETGIFNFSAKYHIENGWGYANGDGSGHDANNKKKYDGEATADVYIFIGDIEDISI